MGRRPCGTGVTRTTADEHEAERGLHASQLGHARRIEKDGRGIIGLRGKGAALRRSGCALIEDAEGSRRRNGRE